MPSAVADLPIQRIRYGPWQGSFRSGTAFECPRTHLAGTADYHYNPRKGSWRRRKGSTQKFDTFGASVGLLAAKWSSKCRQFEELGGDKTSNGIPSVIALLTKETMASGLDDGRFSTLYYRDQANSVNHALGDEYGTVTYPAPGTTQQFRYCAIGNLSGDGGLSRGVDEFQRRLLLGDPRGFLRVGRWFYTPGGPHGVPVRWDGALAGTGAIAAVQATSDVSGFTLQSGGGQPFKWGVADIFAPTINTGYKALQTAEALADRALIYAGGAAINAPWVGILGTATLVAGYSQWTATFQMWLTTSYAGTEPLFVSMRDNAGIIFGATFLPSTLTPTTWTTVTLTLTAGSGADPGANNRVRLGLGTGLIFPPGLYIDYMDLAPQVPSSVAVPSHLIPSGPLPPTHAGVIVKGNPVAGTSGTTRVYPDSDVSIGSWTNSAGTGVALYSYIDDAGTTTDPINDADNIRVVGNSTYICTLGDLGFTPEDDDLVQVVWRAERFVLGGSGIDLTVTLQEGTTDRAAAERTLHLGFIECEFTLTAAEIASIGDWTNLRLKIVTSGADAAEFVVVSSAFLQHRPAGDAQGGGWHGSDRFAYAMAYRFEDDSVWAFSVPRFPNTILPNGFNICTVDSTSPTQGYDKITWTNLPVPLYGVKEKLLLRTNKIDFTTLDNLAISLEDMRIVATLDPSVTTYDDYKADDDAILDDPDKLWIHVDHIMPPRARWPFAGESRVCHSYGGVNPTAIELAPVGATLDYDRNVADDSATAYATPAMYFKLTSTALVLYKDSSPAITLTLAFSTYDTLQDLVDRINATSCAADSMQWRAQILPGQSTDAPCATSLAPTLRTLTGCTVTGHTITRASGLSAIPVGAYVGTGGAYISRINSDLSLTFVSGSGADPVTGTLNFAAGTGDTITGGTAYDGYVRARCNALPEFLYFNTTYLAQFPLEKSSIWMTSANPESYNSAPNCFRGDGTGKHKPPGDVGICMGGAAIGQGFVTPYSKARKSRIANTRDSGTGLDRDYHLSAELDSGCIGPLASGNGCVFVSGPEGWFAMDMDSDLLLSGAIYQHPLSEGGTGVGDFFYEAPLCIAAAGADDDTAYMSAKVMRSALWINYRASSASSTHPNRQVVYDFSDSNAGTGLAAMVRDRPVYDDGGRIAVPVGVLWGWSLPLSRPVTQMCEGRRADGTHIYGWNEANAGSTGDGRIDELEVTDQDNGTDISASWRTPWESGGTSDDISAQEIYSEHVTATTATVTRTFTRALAGDTYTGTPSKSDTLIVNADVWGLPITGARVASTACYCGGTQTAGPAQELRLVELRAKSVRNLTLGAAG